MSSRTITSVLIAAFVLLLAIGLRKTDGADAAAGNCYADGPGPSTPTICN